MRTSTKKRNRRAIAIALTSLLLAAPAAQARLDEGDPNAGQSAPQPMRIADSGGFDWADAGIGAGAALAALVAAGYAVRRHSLPAHS